MPAGSIAASPELALRLYVRGALVGVAVDVNPRRSGEWLGVSSRGATDVYVSGFPIARRAP